MNKWKIRAYRYFLAVVAFVALTIASLLSQDTLQARSVQRELTTYMQNLRDMIFMSTYDSLKKGNMKVFKNHLKEIGTFDDVDEYSLLDRQGFVRYSSRPDRLNRVDPAVAGLETSITIESSGFTTYFFPVTTTEYCARCHPDWPVDKPNSYYKLTLSRSALDAAESALYSTYVYTLLGGIAFLGLVYLLFTLYERKKHEEQMALSVSVFENAVEAIVITTADGRIERINPAFTIITGYSGDEAIGRDIHLLSAGDMNDDAYRELRAGLRERGTWAGELWNQRKNGEVFAVQLSVTAILNPKMRATHFISIFYDISARKEAERALRTMDQMKSEFISTAAHELRTPLNAIMNYTELLRHPEKFGGLSLDQVNTFLDQVYDRGVALDRLIDDLLDVSRIERGAPVELNREEVDLLTVLDQTLDFYRLQHPDRLFLFEKPNGVAQAPCLLDRHRISQVLENLINNAIKYSPAATAIKITCARDAMRWVIRIQDEGVGMTPEQVERIFDKFYRADTVDPNVSGLGLGMSIAKQIVESHGGTIWVTSRLHIGTTAAVSLPAFEN